MNHRRHAGGVAPGVLVLVLAALAALAEPGDLPRFASRADLVILSATAVDRRGRPVSDLRRDEFRVFEDGRPQPVQHFSEGTAAPARLLLLVDASGSMTGALKTSGARTAVAYLLAGLGPNDEAALAGFDHRYRPLVAFTRARDTVLRGVARLEPFGSTALHDALDEAAHEIARAGEGRRAVVVITDGVDTASQRRPDEVLARARAPSTSRSMP
ncbi:MAG TPA: VWA domain-containing protein [Vicinamibacteria bacterium]|nr:VWA domain-containing protein [Vicinamibacteria bacterium]